MSGHRWLRCLAQTIAIAEDVRSRQTGSSAVEREKNLKPLSLFEVQVANVQMVHDIAWAVSMQSVKRAAGRPE